ncbi:hypothetical protein J437_LFUL015431 [Ladona fulva]|uniref:Uncharacterized protein n=1 Tax=Ladona fulva TaxID=123851 RepID=A0A8K0KJB5_LADFU|nr:hypothetical protein J437_LFUL015431 [Ladona fulva]
MARILVQKEEITNQIENQYTKMESKIVGRTVRTGDATFNGKIPWASYIKQFEAASETNTWSPHEKAVALTLALRGEALDVLQALSADDTGDYEELL